jgi:hypothetical protein
MASSIETTSTTTTLKNNGTAYISVDTNENVTLAHPLALASGGSGTVAANSVVQVVNFTTGALQSGTTVLPADDTIPQITEGDEWFTLAITPKHADNKLLIQVVCNMGGDSALDTALALFQDTTANALAVSFWTSYTNNRIFTINHFMTAGTTSATTFKVRGGSNAGTTRLNGRGAARQYGGVASSGITITEYSV